MLDLAANLEFEAAALVRDEMKALEQELKLLPGDDVI